MPKNYRVVIVGCGNIGALWGMDSARTQPASHAAAVAVNPRTELVGLVDVDTVTLQKAGEYFNAPTFGTVEEALEQKPDSIIVAAPPAAHEEILMWVLGKVPLVVCEKPLSNTLEAATRMRDAAQHSTSTVVVNYQRRFFPLYQQARRRIQSGELGTLTKIEGIYSKGLLNNGSHLIDAIHFLTGDRAVYAEGATIGYASGCVATLNTVPDTIEQHDLTLVGDKGSLSITDFGYHFAWSSGEVQIDKRSMVEPTIQHVVECLDGAMPLCGPEDGYKAVQVVDAMQRSVEAGAIRIHL
jgi:predicted dehydrogenase